MGVYGVDVVEAVNLLLKRLDQIVSALEGILQQLEEMNRDAVS